MNIGTSYITDLFIEKINLFNKQKYREEEAERLLTELANFIFYQHQQLSKRIDIVQDGNIWKTSFVIGLSEYNLSATNIDGILKFDACFR